MRVKNEKLFIFFSSRKSKPNDVGREQFLQHQSHGIVPKDPDPYYIELGQGKDSFDFLCSEYQ